MKSLRKTILENWPIIAALIGSLLSVGAMRYEIQLDHTNVQSIQSQLSQLQTDVAYIRGKMDGAK